MRPVRDLLARRGGGPELPAYKDGRRWRDVTSTGHLANDVGVRRVHGEDEPRHALSGTQITTESPSQISRAGTITTCGITHRPRMLIDRSRVTTDETSGIVNDPNDWCKAHNYPRKRRPSHNLVTTVSVETMKGYPSWISRAEPAAGRGAAGQRPGDYRMYW